jgi:hypothetical protein
MMASAEIFVGIDGTTPNWFKAVHFEPTFDLPMSFINCMFKGSVAEKDNKSFFAGPDIWGKRTTECVSLPLMFILQRLKQIPSPMLPRITIAGYSRGAYAAIRVAQGLAKMKIPVYFLCLIDTVKVTDQDTDAAIAAVIDKYDNSFSIESESNSQIMNRLRQAASNNEGYSSNFDLDESGIKRKVQNEHGLRLRKEIYEVDYRDARTGAGNYVDLPGHFVVTSNVKHCLSVQRDFRLGSWANVMGVAPVTFPGGNLDASTQNWCSHSAMGGMPYRGDMRAPEVTPEGEWRECAKVASKLRSKAVAELKVLSSLHHPTLLDPRNPTKAWRQFQKLPT